MLWAIALIAVFLPLLIVDNSFVIEETPYFVRVDGVYRVDRIKV